MGNSLFREIERVEDRRGEMAGSDLLAEVRRDHLEIKSLLAEVADEPDQERFGRLARLIAAHESAEQEVVHPLTSDASGGRPVADARLKEEAEASAALDDLKAKGVGDPGFAAAFNEFREAVLNHAEHEENEEHPLIEKAVPAFRRDELGKQFRDRERSELANAS
jgi:hemerythrin superfamily protein